MASTTTPGGAASDIQPGSLSPSLSSILSGISTRSSNLTTGPITRVPPQMSNCRNVSSNNASSSNTCALRNAYCSLQGSEHALDGLRDLCILWDKSCCGNSALAPQNYWKDKLNSVTSNGCFFDQSPDCTTSNPPGRMSAFAGLKNWMRGPQCYESNPLIAGDPVGLLDPNSLYSVLESYCPIVLRRSSSESAPRTFLVTQTSKPQRIMLTRNHKQNDAMVFQGEEYLNTTCCGDDCQINADRVDVYYWPDPLADTSCSSIVGNGVSYVADGATTDDTGHLYWGCTVYGTSLGIMADQSSTVVRTATLSSIAGISYKAYLVNPWDPSQCGNVSATLSSQQNSTIQSRGVPASLHPRGHSLIITDPGVSTTVLGDYTL